VACCRPEVGSFNVRHAPRVSAETNATLTISATPSASPTHQSDRQNTRTKGPGAPSEAARGAPLRGMAGRLIAAAGRGGACAATHVGIRSPQDQQACIQASRDGPSAAPDLINLCPLIPHISRAAETPFGRHRASRPELSQPGPRTVNRISVVSAAGPRRTSVHVSAKVCVTRTRLSRVRLSPCEGRAQDQGLRRARSAPTGAGRPPAEGSSPGGRLRSWRPVEDGAATAGGPR
jgi:hypothetical protein